MRQPSAPRDAQASAPKQATVASTDDPTAAPSDSNSNPAAPRSGPATQGSASPAPVYSAPTTGPAPSYITPTGNGDSGKKNDSNKKSDNQTDGGKDDSKPKTDSGTNGSTDPGPSPTPPPTDTTAPETTIDFAASTGSSASFDFSSSEAGSTFECRVDSAAWYACGSPDSVSGAAGLHTFEVRASDAAGNINPTPASSGFTVLDTTAPDQLRILGSLQARPARSVPWLTAATASRCAPATPPATPTRRRPAST